MKKCNESKRGFLKASLALVGIALKPLSVFASPNSFTITVCDPPVWDAGQNLVSGGIANCVFFDGQFIWAAIQQSTGGVIKKISVDGTMVSATPVGSGPIIMAYDGANIWVTNYSSHSISIVNDRGTVIATIQLSSQPDAKPEGILFDGRYMWVANNGAGMNSVTKFEASTRTKLADYVVPNNPDGFAFDGTYIWVSSSLSNNVMKLDRNTGAILATYPTGQFPLSIAFDGKNIWVGNGTATGNTVSGVGSVSKIRASDGANLGTFTVGKQVRGVLYDGVSIWTCNAIDNSVTRLRAANTALIGTYPVGKSPRAIAFDGQKIWVANSGENTLTVFPPPPIPKVASVPEALGVLFDDS